VSLAKAVGPAGRVTGVDISDGMLAIARERLQNEGLSEPRRPAPGRCRQPGFHRIWSLDGVFMSFTLELFDNPEIPRVLQECHRILKPGGRLAVVSMTKTDPPGLAVRMYEWFHEHMPNYADCRPIFARQALEQSGFVDSGCQRFVHVGAARRDRAGEETVKIIYIATGAANMYCGSCMHDNALAAGYESRGRGRQPVPALHADASGRRERWRAADLLWRHQSLFDAKIPASILRARPFIAPCRFAGDPAPDASLRHRQRGGPGGERGAHDLHAERRGAGTSASYCRNWSVDQNNYQPDVIHVTNALLIGVVREFKRSLQVPVTCGLHGEDIFLEGLPQALSGEALALIRERAADVDRFLAISTYYAICSPNGSGWIARRSMSSGPGSRWMIIAT
jgi:hypothetical protein